MSSCYWIVCLITKMHLRLLILLKIIKLIKSWCLKSVRGWIKIWWGIFIKIMGGKGHRKSFISRIKPLLHWLKIWSLRIQLKRLLRCFWDILVFKNIWKRKKVYNFCRTWRRRVSNKWMQIWLKILCLKIILVPQTQQSTFP